MRFVQPYAKLCKRKPSDFANGRLELTEFNLKGKQMEIEDLVNDLLNKMQEIGVNAEVIYCFSGGDVVSFEIKIIGYLA